MPPKDDLYEENKQVSRIHTINVHSIAIASLPSTLNFQNWFSRPRNSNILQTPALNLELELRGGAKCPGAQSGIDSPALLHGLSGLKKI